jgi:RimJ/RimL family protein N-acetyltransferase
VPRLVTPAIAPGSLARSRQPVLELDGLVLRPWRASDAPAVVEAYADPGIQRWHNRSMTGLEEAQAWIGSWLGRWAQESGAGWAIDGPAGLSGQVSVRRLDLAEGLAEVSYWVVPAARGNRVAPRALCALSAWLFDQPRLHRVELAHSTLNAASCRVAGHAGFPLEGTKRRESLHRDGWHDMHLHARLAGDPRPALAGMMP